MDVESSQAQVNELLWLNSGEFNPYQQSSPLDCHDVVGYGMSPLHSALPLCASLPWPSTMAAHPQHLFSEVRVPSVPIHVASPVTPPQFVPSSRRSSAGKLKQRKVLTDEDRRKICLYHKDNKKAKQTEIGAIFGVERSTVSKVLSQKEKYLNSDDGTRSTIRRAKAKASNIEKTLAQWVTNCQRHGYPLDKRMIKERALFFANACGGSNAKKKVRSTGWLESFMKQNNLAGLVSDNSSFSVKSDPESPRPLCTNLAVESAIQSPSVLSPFSPPEVATLWSWSDSQSEKIARLDGICDVLGDYQSMHDPGAILLNTTVPDSAGVTSPALVLDSPSAPTNRSHNSSMSSRQQRQKSPTKAKPACPTLLPVSSAVSPESSPDSPTEDEARGALKLLMQYLENQPTSTRAQVYMALGELMKTMEVAKPH